MKANTIRLQEETWEALESEAEERGFASRSEYIRHIIKYREAVPLPRPEAEMEALPNTPPNTDPNTPIEDGDGEAERMDDGLHPNYMQAKRIEQRVSALEQQLTGADEIPAEDDEPADLDTQIHDLELSGSGPVLEERRAAVRACYEFLREHGQGQRSVFTTEVYPDHPAHYDSKRGWWNMIGKEGLRELAERRDDLEPPEGEGFHTYYYVGDED